MGRSEVVSIPSPPMRGESLIGYLIRIADTNCYESSAWILNLAGLTYARMKASTWKKGLPALAYVLQQPLEEISRLGPFNTVEGNHSKVLIANGEVISRYFLRWPTKEICSQCARENGYLSAAWELRFVTHCPKHGCRLRSACSECDEEAAYSRATADFCSCMDIQEWNKPTITEAHVGLLRLLSNKFGGTDFKLDQHGFPEEFKQASLREAIETIVLLGSSLHIGGRVDGRGYCRMSEEKVITQVATAAEALANWPHGFMRYIGNLIVTADNYSDSSFFAERLARLYQSAVSNQSQFFTIFRGFEDCLGLIAEGKFQSLVGKVSPKPGRHKWLACGSDARVCLRVGKSTLSRLMRKGMLKTIVVRRGQSVQRLVTHESIEAYLDLKRRLIGIQSAAYMLSISLHTLKTLVKAGFLTPYHSPDLDGHHSWQFDKEVLAGFLHELEESSEEGDSDPVQLVAAVRKYNKQGLSYVKLLDMIRNGEVELLMYSQTERGFLKFGVDPAALKKLFSNEAGAEFAPVCASSP
ncbi:MAG: TniQ family protein [Thalassospira sp.]|uniref:TniQ family protein n=1 Tax=Thalassospira sp. TaxID=1912094 RepID=UPI0032EBAE72